MQAYAGKQFVGIDLHRRRTVIVRTTETGEVLETVRIVNDVQRLASVMARAGDCPEVVLEATYGWYWAVDALQAGGANVHLAHPLGVKAFEYRRVKNDVRDAQDLADLLRMGRLPEAWIAPPPTRELRELVRHRAKLVGLRTQPDELGPVPHQLTQLPGGRGRDPRLGQAAHPQQIGQVLGIANVVLDPAVLKGLDPQRVGQVDVGTTGLQRIHGPVPTVGGLQHHLRALASPGHHRRQPLHVIDDPHRLQHLTTRSGSNDHRPTTVQIDSHKLLSCIRFHLGASSPSRTALWTLPSIPLGGAAGSGRRPRSFIASEGLFPYASIEAPP